MRSCEFLCGFRFLIKVGLLGWLLGGGQCRWLSPDALALSNIDARTSAGCWSMRDLLGRARYARILNGVALSKSRHGLSESWVWGFSNMSRVIGSLPSLSSTPLAAQKPQIV